MITTKTFTLFSIILYIVLYFFLKKYKINIFIGIILISVICGSYGIIMHGGRLIEDLFLERTDDLEFVATIFGVLFVILFGSHMKFKY